MSLPQTHPHQTKSYYFSGTKVFLQRYTETYRHLLSKCFKNAVPGRHKMVQYNFFSDTKQEHVFWKTFKVRKAFGFLREHIIFNVKWVNFCKNEWSFWEKLYCKMSDLFGQFLFSWLWEFLLENLKPKNSDDAH